MQSLGNRWFFVVARRLPSHFYIGVRHYMLFLLFLFQFMFIYNSSGSHLEMGTIRFSHKINNCLCKN